MTVLIVVPDRDEGPKPDIQISLGDLNPYEIAKELGWEIRRQRRTELKEKG